MFGKRKGNIAARLEEGRTWIKSLEEEVKITQAESNDKNDQIVKLTLQRTDLDEQIKEGQQVANNFKELLVMKD